METTIAHKLKTLYHLQLLHTKIDKIRQLKGLLPEEVSDYEDKVAGLEARSAGLKIEIESLKSDLDNAERLLIASKDAITKYQDQLGSVKNNREYDVLIKEIELQNLDILLQEKKLKNIESEIESKSRGYDSARIDLESNQKELTTKKEELGVISDETKLKEGELSELAQNASKTIDSSLLAAYTLLRKKAKNGLAIVTVERDACSGCFNHTPAQQQAEIRLHQKIIVCEFCGRILVDEELVSEDSVA